MSETMTPKELLELADHVEASMPGQPEGAAAIRSYAELLLALIHLRREGALLIGLDLEQSTLVRRACALGWPGLEEL